MREADAFETTEMLGLARKAKRDPYRFELFGRHLESDETPRVLVEILGGTLLVTDRRVIEFRPHLENHGPWNVKEFLGYVVGRETLRSEVRDVVRRTSPADRSGAALLEDAVVLETRGRPAEIVVSRAPAVTLDESEFGCLREAILGPQAK